jgi:tetrapyrrole methylase family protein / MazG family protein
MPTEPDLTRFDSLVELIALLRGPEGCPWDRKQTHASLREHLLEETYEVLEALDEENLANLPVELGDLLMQVVFHAQVAAEAGRFDIGNVIEGISRKLISRHPHVFAGLQVKDSAEVLVNWEALKKAERRHQGSMLDGVPKILPALAYSQSVQERVARVGFDWTDDTGVLDKLTEELAEFQSASDHPSREAEFGDILFTLANYARRQGIDLESALRTANHKFYRRFSAMEVLARERGKELASMNNTEQNRLWEEVKQAENTPPAG